MEQSRLRFILPVVLLFVAIRVSVAQAERYAVLIGAWSYPYIRKPLTGPSNYVSCLKDIFISKYGFSEDKVRTLLDREASKKNILETLARLASATKEGEFIFIYFSGHGTSSCKKSGRVDFGGIVGELPMRCGHGDQGT